MKSLFKIFVILTLVLFCLAGCTGRKPENKAVPEPVKQVSQPPVPGNETSLLLIDLETNGDYVNSQQYPSLIKASLVNEGLTGKNLIIDIRTGTQYARGHIKGSVNKKFEDLPGFFETGIKPFEYDKIILVCEDGQLSSYTTSLLRLKGYGNVFAMRWGMSCWNKVLAEEGWLKGLSGKYESVLETKTFEKPAPAGMPALKTGFTTGREIGDARFAKLFSEGTDNILINASEVFGNPDKYFIINLERKDKYDDGHIPGAVRYKPEGTLGIPAEMASIPFDKTVVVYCGTGHNSAFATAYLRLFGYDARTLKYGNNSFMHDRMIKQKAALSWLPFTLADVNNFPVVK
jgi:rhodanese-related sulfurtransferase/predicted small lipoprotein YifL